MHQLFQHVWYVLLIMNFVLLYIFFHVGDFEAPKNIHLSVTQKKTQGGARVDPPHTKKGK